MSACKYVEGYGPECAAIADTVFTVGCVHEHLFKSSRCRAHKEVLDSSCGLCYYADGHLCPMNVLDAQPAPSPRPAIQIGGEWL